VGVYYSFPVNYNTKVWIPWTNIVALFSFKLTSIYLRHNVSCKRKRAVVVSITSQTSMEFVFCTLGLPKVVSPHTAICSKFLFFLAEYFHSPVYNWLVTVTMIVTLLVHDAYGLISFQQTLCPMLSRNTCAAVSLWNFSSSSYAGVLYFQHKQPPSYTALTKKRHSFSTPYTFCQFYEIFRWNTASVALKVGSDGDSKKYPKTIWTIIQRSTNFLNGEQLEVCNLH